MDWARAVHMEEDGTCRGLLDIYINIYEEASSQITYSLLLHAWARGMQSQTGQPPDLSIPRTDRDVIAIHKSGWDRSFATIKSKSNTGKILGCGRRRASYLRPALFLRGMEWVGGLQAGGTAVWGGLGFRRFGSWRVESLREGGGRPVEMEKKMA
ncbi:hypothetical protein H6P81_007030 [Aristolochia fimbriata]|uniref:Uncharacterized protein n=1 Tax=Aristolochia fimbriata TaxID=158543 RepID=A0AAV7F2P9_ARIFI|nr:hypothetical protein H6P81_007030 [Aristolochia fimbriata]